MSSLELAGVSVQYGPTQALKGIDVRAPKGSIVALIGPNGAGKTTALKAVMGLQPVAGGEIRLGGGADRPAGHGGDRPPGDRALPGGTEGVPRDDGLGEPANRGVSARLAASR